MTATTPEPPTAQAAHAVRRRLNTSLLTRGRVVVIGLGGIGLFLARALVVFFAGLRQAMAPDETITLLLCDGDAFKPENSYRMDIPDFDNKAAALAQEFLDRFHCPGLNVRWIPEFVSEANAARVIQEGDLVFAAVDNHASRRTINARCSQGGLADVVLISGGNDGVEDGQRGTYGNVQVYVRQGGRDLTAPLDRFHPEIAQPADKSPADMSCIEAAAAGAGQLVWANLAVASAMGNAMLRLLMPPDDQPPYDEVTLDILEAVSLPQKFSHPAD
mgnify:CR=1 FL=1